MSIFKDLFYFYKRTVYSVLFRQTTWSLISLHHMSYTSCMTVTKYGKSDAFSAELNMPYESQQPTQQARLTTIGILLPAICILISSALFSENSETPALMIVGLFLLLLGGFILITIHEMLSTSKLIHLAYLTPEVIQHFKELKSFSEIRHFETTATTHFLMSENTDIRKDLNTFPKALEVLYAAETTYSDEHIREFMFITDKYSSNLRNIHLQVLGTTENLNSESLNFKYVQRVLEITKDLELIARVQRSPLFQPALEIGALSTEDDLLQLLSEETPSRKSSRF